MTVSVDESKIIYDGDGSTVAFDFDFRIFVESDLRVILRSSAGVDTVQTLTTHYSISASPWTSGGTVTMVTAPATGETLVIKSDIAPTQGIDYLYADRFPSQSAENGLDKLTLLVQQIEETLGRTLTLQESTALTTNLALDPSTGQVLYFDGSQFSFQDVVDLGGIAASSFAQTLLDDTSAAAALTTLGVSSFAQTLLDDTNAAAARATLNAAWEPIKQVAVTAVGNIDFENGVSGVVFDGTYAAYLFVFDNVAVATEAANNYIYARVKSGGAWQTSSSTYTSAANYVGASMSDNNYGHTTTGLTQLIPITPPAVTIGCGASEVANGWVLVTRPDNTQRRSMEFSFGFNSTSATIVDCRGRGLYGSGAAWQGLRFAVAAAGVTFAAGGTITMYGMRAPT